MNMGIEYAWELAFFVILAQTDQCIRIQGHDYVKINYYNLEQIFSFIN